MHIVHYYNIYIGPLDFNAIDEFREEEKNRLKVAMNGEYGHVKQQQQAENEKESTALSCVVYF